MERADQFTRWVAGEAELLGLPVLTVDGQRTIAENAERVAGHFGLRQLDQSRGCLARVAAVP
jgi:hypothetical protein